MNPMHVTHYPTPWQTLPLANSLIRQILMDVILYFKGLPLTFPQSCTFIYLQSGNPQTAQMQCIHCWTHHLSLRLALLCSLSQLVSRSCSVTQGIKSRSHPCFSKSLSSKHQVNHLVLKFSWISSSSCISMGWHHSRPGSSFLFIAIESWVFSSSSNKFFQWCKSDLSISQSWSCNPHCFQVKSAR